jgi:DNA-binding MarR family transcriptional regulator
MEKFINYRRGEEFMEENNSQGRVEVGDDGTRYFIFGDKHEARISADELRSYLPQLYDSKTEYEKNVRDCNLTIRQLDVYNFIFRYRDEYHTSPTLGEIADELTISKITTHEHINQLEKKGAIRKEKFIARSIQLLVSPYNEDSR